MVPVHWQRPTWESFLWQPSSLPSDLPEDLSLLLNLWLFFFTLKYLVIFPGTEDVLAEHEKKFLQVMPMRCFCLSPGNPKHRAGKLPGEPHT